MDNDKNDNIEWKKRRKLTPQELLGKAPSIIENLKVDSTFFRDNKCRNLASFTIDGKSKTNKNCRHCMHKCTHNTFL